MDGAVSGIIMQADPQVPDAYRQEYYVGEAEDTAWIIGRVRPLTGPVRQASTMSDVVGAHPRSSPT